MNQLFLDRFYYLQHFEFLFIWQQFIAPLYHQYQRFQCFTILYCLYHYRFISYFDHHYYDSHYSTCLFLMITESLNLNLNHPNLRKSNIAHFQHSNLLHLSVLVSSMAAHNHLKNSYKDDSKQWPQEYTAGVHYHI